MCAAGVRSWIGYRIVRAAGFNVTMLSGGIQTLRAWLGEKAEAVLVTGEGARMTTRKQVVNRLKRARGQMDSLIANIESGDANCREVLIQFAAVNSAMKRASYLAVATIMSQCAIEDADHENDDALAPEAVESLVKTGSMTLEELEELFLRLA